MTGPGRAPPDTPAPAACANHDAAREWPWPPPSWLGARRVDLDRCVSTNDEAARLAAAGAAHGTVVTARAQTGGRGRQGRDWYSPDGENLYFSIVLRPALDPAEAPPMTLAAGLAVADAAISLGVPATVKWPNDVLVRARKLAGVLTETTTRAGRLEHAIMGVGINIETRAFPDALAASATSLALELESGRESAVESALESTVESALERAAPASPPGVAREQVLAAVLGALEWRLDQFFAGGVAAIADDWLARAAIAGRAVEISAGGSAPIAGRARGIDGDGALLVEDATGRVVRVTAGDVSLS